jgi:GNAT superfamily N-acetyltransferase
MPMPDFHIRPATPADRPALGELGALLMRVHHGFDPLRFLAPGRNPEEGYGRFLVSQLGGDEALVLVAERGSEIIGYVYATLEGQSWRELRNACGFIDDVVVRESERESGVATALLEAAMAWLRGRGAPRVLLWSADQNAAAQRLFGRLGFRRTMVEMTREL